MGAKLFALIFFLLFHNNCIAQLSQGKFYGDDGLIYQFGIDTFKTETRYSGFHSRKKISKGTYKIKGDTLILDYISYKNPPEAEFKFISKEPIFNNEKGGTNSVDSALYVHFNIVAENNKPIKPQPILLIKDAKNQTIKGFEADSLGNIAEIFILGKFDLKFKFTALANEEFVIDVDTLMGYKSSIKVKLPERIEYGVFDGNKKFIIKKEADNELELHSIANNRIIILKKAD